jgi:hypothetical protein
MRARVCLAALAIAGCSSSSPPPVTTGRILVALTIDWEGAELAPDAFDALENVRKQIGDAPLTHFVSAAYFCKPDGDATAGDKIARAIRGGDELAVHLHAWQSLARASSVEPRSSPSFFTGTQKLLELEGTDVGFDVDLDAYSIPELRALLRTSRRLLETTRLPVSQSFRAGGYLGTPKVLQAIADEGFGVDSSAIDYRQIDTGDDDALRQRLAQLWPAVNRTSPPYLVPVAGKQLVELPIAAVADFLSAADMIRVVDFARVRLKNSAGDNVVVVLAFHFETATEFGSRIVEAITKLRARADIHAELMFVTIAQAAELVRHSLASR